MKCYICGKPVTLLGDGDLAVLNLVRYRGAVDSRRRGNDSFGFVPHQDLRTDTICKVNKILPTLHIVFDVGFCVSPAHIFKKRYNRTYALTLLVGCGSVRQSTNLLYMESLRKSYLKNAMIAIAALLTPLVFQRF